MRQHTFAGSLRHHAGRYSGSVTTPGMADPTQLPVANQQGPDNTSYNALNVHTQSAGYSYTDPTTSVKIWKVTDSTTPVSNNSCTNDYAEGGPYISQKWGSDQWTLKIYIDTGGEAGPETHYLVDFQKGVGFSNWRTITVGGDLQFAFSNNPATPQIAYVVQSGTLNRYDTSTDSVSNTGNFPKSDMGGWLHQDKDDDWFICSYGGQAKAWRSSTDTTRTRTFSNFDEPHMERDGRYVHITKSVSVAPEIWDLSDDTVDTLSMGAGTSFHNAACRSYFTRHDVDSGGTFPLFRIDPSAATETEVYDLNGYNIGEFHHAGHWVVNNLSGTSQWCLGGYQGNGSWQHDIYEALGFFKLDGSDMRLLCHHYSDTNSYWKEATMTNISPDGMLVMFRSVMNQGGSARSDVFLVEVPTS